MKNKIFNNGIKLLYEYRPGSITSFCIAFEAGAVMEDGYKLGTSHAVEHMLFKGTKSMNELEINKHCDEIFGFNNAMTNYPYCIYYGTTLSTDFYRGFKLYSDIILNPTFPVKGFKEEMDIIGEELKEWKDDLAQSCEDELLFNSFTNRRIKELIIGTEKSIKNITLQDIKRFYHEFYTPDNCVITVVSSLEYEEILNVVEDIFEKWNENLVKKHIKLYEENKSGVFIKCRQGINGAKIQYMFPIHNLNEDEIKILTLFNSIFGEGTSSLLFDLIRTRHGLVYDIGSTIKNEKGIKLFSIYLSTSEKNIDKVLKLIGELIENVKSSTEYFSEDRINRNAKMLKLKKELRLEKSIELSKNLAIYEIMYGKADKFYEELDGIGEVKAEDILKLLNKLFVNPTIQIIKPS